jgi:hypothetical protein
MHLEKAVAIQRRHMLARKSHMKAFKKQKKKKRPA